ncbi:hypothetical protein L6R52_09690 [Myxococcota bacterium]|nr:hypothetical protein [Myxococcota bacterium]
MGDDRPKKSWREIDRGREKGGGSSPRRDSSDREREKLEKSAAYSKYKSNLDKLFTPGGAQLPEAMRAKLGPASPEAESKRKALEALKATPSAETLSAYLATKGELPDDPRLLLALLDVKDEALLPPVLDALLALVEGGKKPSRMLMIQKLDALKHRTSDAELHQKITDLRDALD